MVLTNLFCVDDPSSSESFVRDWDAGDKDGTVGGLAVFCPRPFQAAETGFSVLIYLEFTNSLLFRARKIFIIQSSCASSHGILELFDNIRRIDKKVYHRVVATCRVAVSLSHARTFAIRVQTAQDCTRIANKLC